MVAHTANVYSHGRPDTQSGMYIVHTFAVSERNRNFERKKTKARIYSFMQRVFLPLRLPFRPTVFYTFLTCVSITGVLLSLQMALPFSLRTILCIHEWFDGGSSA